MSNRRQSASSGSQELPDTLDLAASDLHPCPTAPLAGLEWEPGNQPWHHPVLWPVVLAWLCCQGCACGSSKGTSRYPVLLPLMRAHRYHAAVETSRILCVGTSDLMDQVEKHFPAGRGISFVIWQRLQYRDVFILKAFADLVSLNSSEAAVNY